MPDTDLLLALVAVLGVVSTVTTAVLIPFGRWVAGRWRKVRWAERDLRERAEATLFDLQKEMAICEVKLKYCEGELDFQRHEDDER